MERKRSLIALIILVGTLLLPVLATGQGPPPRTALVLGNGAYQKLGRLINPPNDAADFAAALRAAGFMTTVLLDADQQRMEEAVLTFRSELLRDPSGAGVFFFAGHGIQSEGVNYLIPVDADIQSEAQLKRKALPAQEILEYMNEARNRFNMVVLDACRNNPLPSTFRSGSRGLAVVAAAPPESLIVYSTGAGSVAEDGKGRNSPFTAALVKHLGTAGLDVEAMLRRVTADVKAATGNRQTPYKYSSLSSNFFFIEAEALRTAPRSLEQKSAEPVQVLSSRDMAKFLKDYQAMKAEFDKTGVAILKDPWNLFRVSSDYLFALEAHPDSKHILARYGWKDDFYPKFAAILWAYISLYMEKEMGANLERDTEAMFAKIDNDRELSTARKQEDKETVRLLVGKYNNLQKELKANVHPADRLLVERNKAALDKVKLSPFEW